MKRTDIGSLLKGAAAGLIGGLVASFVMNEFQSLVSSFSQSKEKSGSKESDEPATVRAAEGISEGVFDHELSKSEKETAGPAVHYAMGATSGLIYGAAAEIAPITTAGAGLPFGTAVWLIADDLAVPALGLSKPMTEYPLSTHAYGAFVASGLRTDDGHRAACGPKRDVVNTGVIIREALLAKHSRAQTMKIVRYVGSDPARFNELMDNFLGDTYRVSQRAAWAVNYCAEYHRELVRPYFRRLIEQLEREDAHVAVRRNVARLLQFVDIPPRYRGRVFDACYNLVDDPAQPIAVKVFALTVAAKIANDKPELLGELRLMAEKHAPHLSIGFRTRAKRVLASK